MTIAQDEMSWKRKRRSGDDTEAQDTKRYRSQFAPAAAAADVKTFAPRSRQELLTYRVTTVAAFKQELFERQWARPSRKSKDKLAAIPVPLFPGETLASYEKQFSDWLLMHNVFLSALRAQPYQERGYRCQFAHWKLTSRDNPLARYGPRQHHQFSGSLGQSKARSEHEVFEYGERSSKHTWREEHLEVAATVGLDKVYKQSAKNATRCPLAAACHACVNESTSSSSSSQRPNVGNTNNSGKQPLRKDVRSTTDVASPQLKAVREHKAADSADAAPIRHFKLNAGSTAVSDDLLAEPEPSHVPRLPGLRGNMPTRWIHDCVNNHEISFASENLPNWVTKLIFRVHELEDTVDRLQQELAIYRATPPGSSETTMTEGSDTGQHDCAVAGHLKSSSLARDFSAKSNPTTTRRGVVEGVDQVHRKVFLLSDEKKISTQTPHAVESLENDGGVAQAISFSVPGILDVGDDPSISRASPQVKFNPERNQLCLMYTSLHEKIKMNERAIDDSLEAIRDLDESMTQEYQKQITELCVSIDKEKAKRATALATLIFFNWSGSKETLTVALQDGTMDDNSTLVNHQLCARACLCLEQKEKQVSMLETQIRERYQFVNSVSSSLSQERKSRTFREIRELSDTLDEENAALSILERERQAIFKHFVQADVVVRNSVRELMLQNVVN